MGIFPRHCGKWNLARSLHIFLNPLCTLVRCPVWQAGAILLVLHLHQLDTGQSFVQQARPGNQAIAGVLSYETWSCHTA